ncbi:AP-4 complex accessory subunit Tepsin [Hondaea fermentalgiana]|uniref:AP-4 complex accessory subunit Tepsin n=1 Tax=Hondaea fermentalgiana TaxID=2315210 RepID=A0A2R5GX34_9STRA|nr:AP-4 complex accessory subunit Tepsin [Hondaea fermentalgiana]|eukprot:GBG32504.1 AP-4 complex accessory subunit Tepsin [Hondaea fermentalgiana]
MNRTTLAKATSTEDSPTPGYLYGEVAKMTFEGADVTNKVCKYLVDRLKRKEPVVKHKVLLIIKQVCRRGDGSFRRAIQAGPNIGEVKACLQFTGPADPLKGDQPYRAVREAAKEALEAIFDNSTEITSSNSALARRIQGYGASSAPSGGGSTDASSHYDVAARSNGVTAARYSNGGSTAGGSGGYGGMVNMTSSGPQYQGIGNPNFKDPRNQPKGFMDRVKDRIEEYSDKASKSGAAAGIQQWLGSDKRGTPPRHDSGSYAGPSAGGGAGGYTGSYTGPSSGGFAGSGQTASSFGAAGHAGPWGGNSMSSGHTNSPSQQRTDNSSGGASGTVSDGRYERSLVDGLCGRGGVRPVPSREKLSAFLTACKTLDAQVVMPILYEKLASAEWKVQHKALCVCEALVQAEDLEAFVDYLDEHAEILEDLRRSTQANVRTRTQSVWKLLYGDEAGEDVPAPAPSSTSAAAPAQMNGHDDLLDFGDAAAAVASSTEAVGYAPAAAPESMPAPAPASTTTATSANGNGMSNGSGSLFGSLQVKSASQAPSTARNEVSASEDNNDDLLFYGEAEQNTSQAGGDEAPAPTAPASAAGSTDLDSLLGGDLGGADNDFQRVHDGAAKAKSLASQLEALSMASGSSSSNNNNNHGKSETSQSQAGDKTGFSFIQGGSGPGSSFAQTSSSSGNTLKPTTSSGPQAQSSPFDDLMAPSQPAQAGQTGSGIQGMPGLQGNLPQQTGGLTPQQLQFQQFQQFQQLMQMQQQIGMAPSPQQQQQLMAMLQQGQMQQMPMQHQGAMPPQQMQHMAQTMSGMPTGSHGLPGGGVGMPSSMTRSVSAASSSSQQSKPQPDKFDFVSSTMAEMK